MITHDPKNNTVTLTCNQCDITIKFTTDEFENGIISDYLADLRWTTLENIVEEEHYCPNCWGLVKKGRME